MSNYQIIQFNFCIGDIVQIKDGETWTNLGTIRHVKMAHQELVNQTVMGKPARVIRLYN